MNHHVLLNKEKLIDSWDSLQSVVREEIISITIPINCISSDLQASFSQIRAYSENKNLPIDFITKYPEVQWKDISGFRDVIVHGYFEVDLDKVWVVIKEDLPTLKQQIQKIKKDFKKMLNLYDDFYKIYGDQDTVWDIDDLDEMRKIGQEFMEVFAVNFSNK